MRAVKMVALDDRLTIANTLSWLGGSALAVFGVLGLTGIALGVQVAGDAEHTTTEAIPLFVGGACCVLLGLAVQTLGYMTIVDRESGRVRYGWSTLGYWWSRSMPLAAFKAVSVTPSGASRRRLHLVGMTAHKVALVFLAEYNTSEASLTAATEIARFGGLEVFDEAK